MDPSQREAIIRALNDDASRLLSELDPDDPLAARLREELRLCNEHLYRLLAESQRAQEPPAGDKFDSKVNQLLEKLEESWQNLNRRVAQPLPRDLDAWEQLVIEHKVRF